MAVTHSGHHASTDNTLNHGVSSISMLNIGVLALQGAFAEHVQMLHKLGVNGVEVRKASQLADLHGLIIPGGESTAISLIGERWGMLESLRDWVRAGKPVWGTCAGMIMLADHIEGGKVDGQALIGGLDVTVRRNHFGRQVDSFRQKIDLNDSDLGPSSCSAVFIRAPVITTCGPSVRKLATLTNTKTGTVTIAVRQGNLLATAFHPELTTDTRWHCYFLALVANANAESCGGAKLSGRSNAVRKVQTLSM